MQLVSTRQETESTNASTIPVVTVTSYATYPGVKGTFGQFGTAELQVTYQHANGAAWSSMTVAVKTFRTGCEEELKQEISALWKLNQALCRQVPQFFGKALLPSGSEIGVCTRWGIVMERLPVTLDQLLRGHGRAGEVQLPDLQTSLKIAVDLFATYLSAAQNLFRQSHAIGLAHADVKPNNVGIRLKKGHPLPIRQVTDIEIVFFDWGMGSASWRAGTTPYSQKCYFSKQCGSPMGMDYFQSLMVVVVYMVNNPSAFYKTETFRVGAIALGDAWITARRSGSTQAMGWLQFCLTHSLSVCTELFHTEFCSKSHHYQQFYANCQRIPQLDKILTALWWAEPYSGTRSLIRTATKDKSTYL